MTIRGLVDAKHEGHAYKILMDLVNEGILDYFDVTGHVVPLDHADDFDAYVDLDGYLNLAEDYAGPLSDSIYPQEKLFVFDAEYLGA